jgi:16S rRNA (adenine1518-N6/adenine1519-N6)-dimethyltransferase
VTFVSPKILLRRLGLRPKKAWGQHFLLSAPQARRIAGALELCGPEIVVEIGAGLGALTGFLAPLARKVVAIERDPLLARFLEEELFPDSPVVQVRCQDVLEFDFLECARDWGQTLAVVGNLPYQITSPLLFKLIQERAALAQAVLMMQQEVGDRLLASRGTKDYGILSVLVQYHFSATRLFSLTPANFYPPPQVDSTVLRLLPEKAILAQDEDLLIRVVKGSFAKRRKTLNNNLVAQAAAFALTREEMRAALLSAGIDPQRRGETLSVAEFVAVTNAMGDKSRKARPERGR